MHTTAGDDRAQATRGRLLQEQDFPKYRMDWTFAELGRCNHRSACVMLILAAPR
ncbi:hypothetical protein GW17_00005391 [Ensete ventricosum]|nr:hypothetical protein GW17_00005391 [Ensete ventricosum]